MKTLDDIIKKLDEMILEQQEFIDSLKAESYDLKGIRDFRVEGPAAHLINHLKGE